MEFFVVIGVLVVGYWILKNVFTFGRFREKKNLIVENLVEDKAIPRHVAVELVNQVDGYLLGAGTVDEVAERIYINWISRR